MYRIVKQLHPAPSSSSDPHWAPREAPATTKMNELSGSDSSGRKYKIIVV